jgi:putative RecB family exonuclease
MAAMSYPVPTSMSPSRVEAFVSCPLAFRFASIEKLPEPPSPHTTKGSLVHRALELLFPNRPSPEPGGRPRRAGQGRIPHRPRVHCWPRGHTEAFADGWSLVELLAMEDHLGAQIGLELRLRAGGIVAARHHRSLELDEGRLVVVDYKTGKSPGALQQNLPASLLLILCERCSASGLRPCG